MKSICILVELPDDRETPETAEDLCNLFYGISDGQVDAEFEILQSRQADGE